MNPLSSHPKNLSKLIILSLVVLLLGPACLSSMAIAYEPTAQPTVQDEFSSYGFEVEGFSDQQEEIIHKTLDAYALVLGSPDQLKKIVQASAAGENRKITFDPNFLGANSSMKLSPTVFSLEKALAANFPSYATVDDENHTRVVIGHEIGHILIWVIKYQTGVDWAKSYAQRVNRDWQAINDSLAPEQEAVTELSLKVQQLGYYLTPGGEKIETNPEITAEIDSWAVDFIASLKSL